MMGLGRAERERSESLGGDAFGSTQARAFISGSNWTKLLMQGPGEPKGRVEAVERALLRSGEKRRVREWRRR